MKTIMKTLRWACRGASFAVCILTLAAPGSAWSATLTLRNLNDSGPGSLREAVDEAAAGDTITFGVYGTITLTSGALTIDKDFNIEGPGPYRFRISGNHAGRLFVIRPNRTVTLAGMTISDGLADGNSPFLPSSGGGRIEDSWMGHDLQELAHTWPGQCPWPLPLCEFSKKPEGGA